MPKTAFAAPDKNKRLMHEKKLYIFREIWFNLPNRLNAKESMCSSMCSSGLGQVSLKFTAPKYKFRQPVMTKLV